MKINLKNRYIKTSGWFLLSLVFFGISYAFAADDKGSGNFITMITNLQTTFSPLVKLITALAFIAGIGFFIGGIFKLKAHKDNPTQITIGAGITLLFVGVGLVGTPLLIESLTKTIFPNEKMTGTGGWEGPKGTLSTS